MIELSKWAKGLAAPHTPSPLARNTLWALGGYGLRILIQAVYFVAIARSLGPREYGAFVAVTALASLISPFVGLGTGNLLVRNVAHDRKLFASSWGNGLVLTFASGLILAAAVILAGEWFLPRGVTSLMLACIAVSDLVFIKIVELVAWGFQAFEILSKNAQLNVLISLSRLTGIAVLASVVPHPTALEWSGVYLTGSVLAALIAIVWGLRRLGRPRLALNRVGTESLEGIYFSVSLSAQTIYNDIDKTMVARLATLEAAGIYGAAYRLIDVAFIPVRALLNAAYPGFFRKGKEGIQSTVGYARHLLRRALPYSVFSVAALLAGSAFVPRILGAEYVRVTEALRWLALLPLLKTLHYFAADSLTGAGRQRARTAAQVAVAFFNFLINLWLIPAYGWRGAAWSSLASDGFLALILWILVARFLRRESLAGAGREVLPMAEPAQWTGIPCAN